MSMYEADEAMFEAREMELDRDENGNIVPRVHLLWMTPDPLGAVAAMAGMYEGKITYDLADVTDAQREHYFAQSLATHLQAPLEAVKLHFMFEGVTRAFTQQLNRQRTAVYAQESLRFAVKEEPFVDITMMPPSIVEAGPGSEAWHVWFTAIGDIDSAYHRLIGLGIPAEDARGIVHHNIVTRTNYVTDLRNLAGHAGNRLCTQAQFEWRRVFLGIVSAIANHGRTGTFTAGPVDFEHVTEHQWQYELIADSPLFRPICYQLNKCPFQATFDRACTIRERVDAFSSKGVSSDQWHRLGVSHGGIKNEEWLLDADAARST